jgi:RimJ/RimL family protein N-acetyltransferase
MLEAWARERGLDRLTCAAQAHNTRGRRFAERLGFAEEARMRRYVVVDGRVADRVRYGKLLAV